MAERLGLIVEFTQGKTLEDWLGFIVDETRKENPGFPSYEEFKEQGVYDWDYEKSAIAFQQQIEDPEKYPFPTPSGKIEFFSSRLWDLHKPDEIPALPQYISAWEGPEDPLCSKYPLQCIGHHTKRRVHSMFDNND